VPGALADLVLVRRDIAANVMLADTIDGFIAHAGREAVESVMIDGRWVLRDDRILTFDEAHVVRNAAAAHARIADRAATIVPAIGRALPALAAQFARFTHAS
jgi:cytosine/adenosine deaminase-related metal-dependent hydrolase